MKSFADVLAGAKVVPELPDAVLPNASVAFDVMVNVAIPTLPRLSVTVTVCAPATPALVATAPAGIVNKNTDVPCSVTTETAGAIAAALVEPTMLPTATEAMVDVGPKPVTVAVTTVPTGPVAGDSVTVGVVSVSVVVATLAHESLRVKVEAEPGVIAGRLTVPVYAPVALSALLLSVVGSAVVTPAATVIEVPANVDSAITFVYVIPVGALGNPEPETVTDAPAATDDGVTVTDGVVIVNVPAITLVVASEIMTVCAPTARP